MMKYKIISKDNRDLGIYNQDEFDTIMYNSEMIRRGNKLYSYSLLTDSYVFVLYVELEY